MKFRVIWLALKYPLPYLFNYTNTKWRLSYFRLEPLFGTFILLRNISTIYSEYISFEKFALDSVSVQTIEGTVTDDPRLSSTFLYLPSHRRKRAKPGHDSAAWPVLLPVYRRKCSNQQLRLFLSISLIMYLAGMRPFMRFTTNYGFRPCFRSAV